MKNAYALLGLSFLIVFIGVYFVLDRADTLTPVDTQSWSSGGPVERSINSQTNSMTLLLTSPAFEPDGDIPSKYTCDGANTNPELTISGVPDEAKSLVLLMYDPDIPESVKENIGQDSFDHWVLYNIAPRTGMIPEGTGNAIGSPGVASNGTNGYVGACPPDGEHRYIFRLYAIDMKLDFAKAPARAEVEAAMEGHILEETELIGNYKRVD